MMARPYGSGRVYRRGGSWWIAWCVDGKEIREPGGRTQRAASKKLRDRVSQGDDYAPGQDRITVKVIVDDYLLHRRALRSIGKLRCHAVSLLAGLGDRRAARVMSSDVEAYVAGREALGRARATINRELELLRAAYRHAAGQKPRKVSPSKIPSFKIPKVHNARRGFLSHEQVEAILQNISDLDLRDFLAWRYWTAMRPIETVRLTWEDVDLGAGIVTLHAADDKTGKGRSIAVAGPLKALMERRQARRVLGCPLVFHHKVRGKRGQPVKDYRKAWRTACKAVGLVAGIKGGLIPYDLRRSGLRNLTRAGVSETVAMGISGHRTRSTFDRYNITSAADTGEAIERVYHGFKRRIRTTLGQRPSLVAVTR
jgi:integrase